MESTFETMQQGSLGRLLALPAELRNEIYSYLLPYPLPDLIIRARYVRLRWIVASRSLFNDVAPAIYSDSCFSTYLKLDPMDWDNGTIEGNFTDHLRLTYGQDSPDWIVADASSLVRHICVDVAAPDLRLLLQTIHFPRDGFENIIVAFKRYFRTASQAFPNLQSLRICFQNRLADANLCPSDELRTALMAFIDSLKQTLPVEVSNGATRNYNALSPLVSLPVRTRAADGRHNGSFA